ncbi:hypothetical protein BZL39_E05670 [Zygosaccharomyces parabailii]|nr:hypothetical protein BZL39_E05670 [Zygosaccharomyces parabailii]
MSDGYSGDSKRDPSRLHSLSRPSSGHSSSPATQDPHQRHQIGSNIKVYVRCRSRNQREIDEKSSVVVSTMGRKGKSVILSNPSSPLSHPKKTYTFDEVFGADSDQESIFSEVARSYIQEMLEGYNCTIFAYGQTGTGKTYTMSGDMSIWGDLESQDKILLGEHAGIIPRVLVHLFKQLSEETTEYSVKISFLELYNERLKDLLSDSNSEEDTIRIFDNNNSSGHVSGSSHMKIQKSKSRATSVSCATVPLSSSSVNTSSSSSSITVKGMEERYIKSAYEGLQLLTKGSMKRKVAATKCNDLSSRSHTIFTIVTHIARTDPVSGKQYVKIGKLNLVDLAGSENINRSGAENMRAQEAGLINKSLLTLGRVINALVEHSHHIPYRGSKLTRLLQDSLGGKTKTCIIATISPARISMDETVSTLEYATRAKSIKNTPQVNQSMSKDSCIIEYIHEIERLRQELKASRQKEGMYITQEQYDLYESNSILVEEQKVVIQNMGEQIKRFKEKYVEQTELSKEAQRQLKDSQRMCDTLRAQKNFILETFEKYHNTCNDHAAKIEHIHEGNIALMDALKVERDEMSTSALNNADTIDKILSTLVERSNVLTELKSNLETHTRNFQQMSAKVLLDFETEALSHIMQSKTELSSIKMDDFIERIQTMHSSIMHTLHYISKPWKKDIEGIYFTHKHILENCGKQLCEYIDELENSFLVMWKKLKGMAISEVNQLQFANDRSFEGVRNLINEERKRSQFLENELLIKQRALKESNEQLEKLEMYFKNHLTRERRDILSDIVKAIANSEKRHRMLDEQMFEKSSSILNKTKEISHAQYVSDICHLNRQHNESLTTVDDLLGTFKTDFKELSQEKSMQLERSIKYQSIKDSFQEFLPKLSKDCTEYSSKHLLKLIRDLDMEISAAAESLGNEITSIVNEARQNILCDVKEDETHLRAALENLTNLSDFITEIRKQKSPQHFQKHSNVLETHCTDLQSVILDLKKSNEYLTSAKRPKIGVDLEKCVIRKLPRLDGPVDYSSYKDYDICRYGEKGQNGDVYTHGSIFNPSTPMPVPDQPLPKVLVPKSINSSTKRSHTLPSESRKSYLNINAGGNNLKRRFTLDPPEKTDKENIDDSQMVKKTRNTTNVLE